jgi:hypothetical protein
MLAQDAVEGASLPADTGAILGKQRQLPSDTLDKLVRWLPWANQRQLANIHPEMLRHRTLEARISTHTRMCPEIVHLPELADVRRGAPAEAVLAAGGSDPLHRTPADARSGLDGHSLEHSVPHPAVGVVSHAASVQDQNLVTIH